MSGVVEAALWALALVVLFSVFIDLVWVLTGTLESLCEPLFVCCRRGASDEERARLPPCLRRQAGLSCGALRCFQSNRPSGRQGYERYASRRGVSSPCASTEARCMAREMAVYRRRRASGVSG